MNLQPWLGDLSTGEAFGILAVITLVILLVVLVVLLIFRTLVCWYFKIDKILEVLNRIADQTKAEDPYKNAWNCPKCNQMNKTKNTVCEKCGYRIV